LHGAQGVDDFPQAFHRLLIPQPRSVGRAHVERNIVAQIRERAQRGRLICCRGGQLGVATLAEADAPRHAIALGATARQSVGAHFPTPRWAAMRRAASAAPGLLKPMRLTNARSAA
jgi:hypothetical protein